MKLFYQTYFNGTANNIYYNLQKGFKSYSITFPQGARLELMTRTDIKIPSQPYSLGWAHLTFSLGNREQVDKLTSVLKRADYSVINGPRLTGDGYYESVIEDPEGNQIELVS